MVWLKRIDNQATQKKRTHLRVFLPRSLGTKRHLHDRRDTSAAARGKKMVVIGVEDGAGAGESTMINLKELEIRTAHSGDLPPGKGSGRSRGES